MYQAACQLEFDLQLEAAAKKLEESEALVCETVGTVVTKQNGCGGHNEYSVCWGGFIQWLALQVNCKTQSDWESTLEGIIACGEGV